MEKQTLTTQRNTPQEQSKQPESGARVKSSTYKPAIPHIQDQTRNSPPLSPTERRVYDLLLQRMTERQVAEHIGRSHNTVHVHVRNIYRKLGIRTRKQLLELPYQQAKASRRIP